MCYGEGMSRNQAISFPDVIDDYVENNLLVALYMHSGTIKIQ